jgi:plastocyanin
VVALGAGFAERMKVQGNKLAGSYSKPVRILLLGFTRTIQGLIAGLAACLFLSMATIAYPYHAEAVRNGGTISGVVEYEGAPPSPALLAITKDRNVCGTSAVYDQSLVVGHDRGVANAVVTIADIAQGEPMKPEAAVRFDQKGCQYIPHVAVFPAGSTVVIINSDGILHNIHTESVVNPVIDLAQPGFKKQIRVTVEKPEVIKVTCDAHNWMEGWWYVTANPYYAITDGRGHYTIRNVPPGTYTLRVWQERLGVESQHIIVRPDAVTAANFMLKSLKNHGSD